MSDKNEVKAGAQRITPPAADGQLDAQNPVKDASASAVNAPSGKLTAEQEKERQEAIDAEKRNAQLKHESEGADDADHVIADGQSVTSLIGLLDEKQPVKLEHFFNKQEDFDRLVKAGVIVPKRK